MKRLNSRGSNTNFLPISQQIMDVCLLIKASFPMCGGPRMPITQNIYVSTCGSCVRSSKSIQSAHNIFSPNPVSGIDLLQMSNLDSTSGDVESFEIIDLLFVTISLVTFFLIASK